MEESLTLRNTPCVNCVSAGVRCLEDAQTRASACAACIKKKIRCGEGPGQRGVNKRSEATQKKASNTCPLVRKFRPASRSGVIASLAPKAGGKCKEPASVDHSSSRDTSVSVPLLHAHRDVVSDTGDSVHRSVVGETLNEVRTTRRRPADDDELSDRAQASSSKRARIEDGKCPDDVRVRIERRVKELETSASIMRTKLDRLEVRCKAAGNMLLSS